MRRIVMLLVLVGLVATPVVWSGNLAGVTMSNTAKAGDTTLHLNGMGLRTKSFLKVKIYVAGLYVEQKSTKADTLECLRSLLRRADVCASVIFSVDEWRHGRKVCLQNIQRQFPETMVIVRSSAQNEDSVASAMAGAHDSVIDVSSASKRHLSAAIEQVVSSYTKTHSDDLEHDQILVQPMVDDVSMSGVVFTRDMNTGAPYYVINYDDVSGKTDTVTSGATDTNRTLLVHRGEESRLRSSRVASLLRAVGEIEDLAPGIALDRQFGVGILSADADLVLINDDGVGTLTVDGCFFIGPVITDAFD